MIRFIGFYLFLEKGGGVILKRYSVGFNYEKNDNNFEWYIGDDKDRIDLSYSEVCYLMYKALEEYVDLEIITKDKAYDLVGDYYAFNKFMDDINYEDLENK